MILLFILYHPVFTLACFPLYWLANFLIQSKTDQKYDFLFFYFLGFAFSVLGMPLSFLFVAFSSSIVQWILVIFSYALLITSGHVAAYIYMKKFNIEIQK
ncbi:hypothetical protein [Leptospira idonii]|uniref:Uncharacterized protein n=1 Tax=Leptospira idonii TaxID=1193500 RepID=A0A4R9M0A9_9LEPT|nr:hypothetical protein [Leptospira idonii]TGN20090.1 hypothetical protein EHS15_05165 [Leptospira idonii]